VYAGGYFTRIGGEGRSAIASLDPVSGEARAWDPSASGTGDVWVAALKVVGGAVYAGGWFDHIGGAPRSCLAALDASTGRATPWAPNPDEVVLALAGIRGLVYAGGRFERIGGQPRRHLAAVDASSGMATAWDPCADGAVCALLVSDGLVYAGGEFDSVGGRARRRIAALEAVSGTATAWAPDTGGDEDVRVNALARKDGRIYAGGIFGSVGGQGRSHLAEIDAGTGLATAWAPEPGDEVRALTLGDAFLYAGGYFRRMGVQPQAGVAAIGIASSGPPLPSGHSAGVLELCTSPNPFCSYTTVRFRLASAACVSLEVYDLAGRRVVSLLEREPRPAGPSEVAFRAEGWRAGVYLCRLDSGGQTATCKMLMVP
jgi:hypothetical protein